MQSHISDSALRAFRQCAQEIAASMPAKNYPCQGSYLLEVGPDAFQTTISERGRCIAGHFVVRSILSASEWSDSLTRVPGRSCALDDLFDYIWMLDGATSYTSAVNVKQLIRALFNTADSGEWTLEQFALAATALNQDCGGRLVVAHVRLRQSRTRRQEFNMVTWEPQPTMSNGLLRALACSPAARAFHATTIENATLESALARPDYRKWYDEAPPEVLVAFDAYVSQDYDRARKVLTEYELAQQKIPSTENGS